MLAKPCSRELHASEGERSMKKLYQGFLSATVASLLACVAVAQPVADTVFVNAKVFTSDAQQPMAQAFSVHEGRFLKVGTRADVLAIASPAASVIDLDGK